MRSAAGLVLMALICQALTDPVATAAEGNGPVCLTRARAQLPGQTMAFVVKGGSVGRRHVLFRRGDVELVIDFDVLESTTQEFLREEGATRFPEDADLLRRLAQAMKSDDEIQGDALARTQGERARLDLRLAVVLDRGAFLIRDLRPKSKGPAPILQAAADYIVRLDYNYECGDLCGTGGRVFYTDACQQLLAVTDWVR